MKVLFFFIRVCIAIQLPASKTIAFFLQTFIMHATDNRRKQNAVSGIVTYRKARHQITTRHNKILTNSGFSFNFRLDLCMQREKEIE